MKNWFIKNSYTVKTTIVLLLFFVLYLNLNVGKVKYKLNSTKTRNYTEIRKIFNISENFENSDIDSVIEISKRTKVLAYITFNVIYRESRFDSTAINKFSGCTGYMQLNPRYFKKPKNRFENIFLGLSFLRERYDALGSWELSIAYFIGGSNAPSNTPAIKYIMNNGKDVKF